MIENPNSAHNPSTDERPPSNQAESRIGTSLAGHVAGVAAVLATLTLLGKGTGLSRRES